MFLHPLKLAPLMLMLALPVFVLACGGDDDESGNNTPPGPFDSGASPGAAGTAAPGTAVASQPGGSPGAGAATPGSSGTRPGGAATPVPGTPVVVGVSRETADAGSEVTVKVTVDPPEGKKLGAWTVDLTYDPNVLTPTACGGGGLSVCNEKYSSTVVRLVGISLEGIEGELGTVTFKATGAAGAKSAVTVNATSCTTPEAEPLPCSGVNGEVSIR